MSAIFTDRVPALGFFMHLLGGIETFNSLCVAHTERSICAEKKQRSQINENERQHI